MLEPLAINLLAGGISTAGALGVDKVQRILRRDRFSADVDDLTTEFTDALRDSLSTTVSEGDHSEITDVEANWTTIAEELAAIEVVFTNEQEAVVRITDAVASGLEIDLSKQPAVRDAVEAAVADAYQTALNEFADRVAGTKLADIFDAETNIELTATLSDVQDQLGHIQRELRSQRRAILRDTGFDWLDPLYLERRTTGHPVAAWRTGFNLAEVAAGYPFQRECPPDDGSGERVRLVTEILDEVTSNPGVIVLGDGGSGKSTICKQVACRWHTEERGPVFYRARRARTQFDTPGTLSKAIRRSDGNALVVVEDVATSGNAPIYEILDEFEDDPDVSFLFDSRETTWRDAEELTGAPTLKRTRQRLATVSLPELDVRECERAIEHYEELTNETVGRSGVQLYGQVQDADIGGPLVLAYELTGPAVQEDSTRGVSALHDDVQRAYTDIDGWADEELPRTVAMMVNVLNAAELPVEAELIHALGTDTDDHLTIERTVQFLSGSVINTGDDGIQTPHTTWSHLYLETVLQSAGERLARYRFEQCVDALFRLCDDRERRDGVARWLGTESEVLSRIEAAPEEAASGFARHVTRICRERPGLSDLYGTQRSWGVELPGMCSDEAELDWHRRRGSAHLQSGKLDAAEAEWSELERLVAATEFASPEDRAKWEVVTNINFGQLERRRGNLDDAIELIERALAIGVERENERWEAASRLILGRMQLRWGAFDAAQDHLETTLELAETHGFTSIEAGATLLLGQIALRREEVDVGMDLTERGMRLSEQLDNRAALARAHETMAMAKRTSAEYEAALAHHRDALSIFQDIGNHVEEGWSLINIAQTARKTGKFDMARGCCAEALEIFDTVGNRPGVSKARLLSGVIATHTGDMETATNRLERVLETFRETNNRTEEANALTHLGIVARERGHLEEAKEKLETALELARATGDTDSEGTILNHLGHVAQERGDAQAALGYYERELEIWESLDAAGATLQVLADLVDICEKRGAVEDALQWCEQAIEVAESNDQQGIIEEFHERQTALQAVEDDD